ncbi:hypothetical protein ACB094_12G020400 [Castanea mollissima]
MEKKALDYILVPLGLLAMVAYHLWLLYRIINYPNKTVIGINTVHRRFWVRAMMEDASKNGILAIQTLRNNLMASIRLASIATMLSSIIAVLMSSGNQDKSALLVFGDRSELDFSIKFKFSSILVCFLFTLLFSVQSIRYYSHASFLITIVPHEHHKAYVAKTVIKGSYFWSLGLRAFYFSFPLFLWIFGPIPMCLSCFVFVILLYFLDFTFDEHYIDEENFKHYPN